MGKQDRSCLPKGPHRRRVPANLFIPMLSGGERDDDQERSGPTMVTVPRTRLQTQSQFLNEVLTIPSGQWQKWWCGWPAAVRALLHGLWPEIRGTGYVATITSALSWAWKKEPLQQSAQLKRSRCCFQCVCSFTQMSEWIIKPYLSTKQPKLHDIARGPGCGSFS